MISESPEDLGGVLNYQALLRVSRANGNQAWRGVTSASSYLFQNVTC